MSEKWVGCVKWGVDGWTEHHRHCDIMNVSLDICTYSMEKYQSQHVGWHTSVLHRPMQHRGALSLTA